MKPTIVLTLVAALSWIGSSLLAAVPLPILPRMVPASTGVRPIVTVLPLPGVFETVPFDLERAIRAAALVRIQA